MPLGSITAPWANAGVPPGPVESSGLTAAANSLVGNPAAAAGPVKSITVGSGLNLSAGGVLTANTDNFDGIVNTYADLPVDGTAALNAIYLVRQNSGTWLINRHPAGLYQRIATTGVRDTDWQYLGEWLEEFSDANFGLYNAADNTKALAFDLSGITTGTKRTLTIPNASGTLLINTLAPVIPAATFNQAAGNTRYLTLQTAGVKRWDIGVNATAEGGANAGSDFNVIGYSDAGAALGTWLSILRATGAANFSTSVTSVNSQFTGYSTFGATIAQSANGEKIGLNGYMLIANGQLILWRDSTTGITNQGFIFYDATNVLNFGTNNSTKMQLSVTGLAVTGLFTASGVIISTGANLSHAASRVTLSYEGASASYLQAYGVNAGTQGTLSVRVYSSDGSMATVPGVFSSTGLAVTGTLSTTGAITSTSGANSTVLTNSSAGIGWVQGISLANTGGNATFGVENSAGGGRINGSTAYDSFYSGGPISFSVNNGANLHMRLSSTGLTITGALVASTGFGCNSKTAQTAFASGGAAPAGGVGTAAGGWDTAAHRDSAITLLNNIRTALVNNGIMS